MSTVLLDMTMRIAFFGQTGPYAPVALRRLVAARLPEIEIALVVEGRKHPRGRWPHHLRKAAPAPLPEGECLADLAVAAGIPALETSDINTAAAVRILERFELDWMVCVGFDRLFKPPVLATARAGRINAHPSRLPRLRGPSPLFWSLRSGETEIGVTLHAMDEREDHGIVYAQETFVRPRNIGGDELYHLAGEIAARLLMAVLARAASGSLIGTPQDHAQATRAPRPRPEDAFVDPAAWSCEHLVDFACGAPFFRTPWLRLGSDVFFLRRGLLSEPGKRLPGHYVQQGSTLIVACKDGLAHLEIQV